MKSTFTKSIALTMAFVAIISFRSSLHAQCNAGEIEVSMEVHTDNWGYECYWEITPNGNACGNGTIASGGNTAQMDCAAGGDQNATTSQGYGDNADIVEGEWCLNIGETYTLHFVDDYGDGGTLFHILIGGLELFAFQGSGNGNTWDFTVTEPLAYNAWLWRPIIYGYLYSDEYKIVSAELINFGSANLFAIEASYSFDGGPEVTEVFTGFDIAPNERHIISFTEPWEETVLGEYDLVITIGTLNGTTDEDLSNNTLTEEIVLGAPIPDLVYNNINGTMIPELSTIGDINEDVEKPTDLDFHPTLTRNELWVINRGTENSGGSTVIFHNAGMGNQTEEYEEDGNGWHFMSLPSAMAFGRNENWSSSPSVTDANHSGGYFTGPTLWSSDPDIYAEPSGGNGSHLDMIHQSPNSMGICNAGDNRFYLYDGYHDRIYWYDFVTDHGPGNDDHSDGRVREFEEPVLNNFNTTVPNHMILDENTGWLYVCDNGGATPRVIRLNTNTAVETGEFNPLSEEVLAETTTYSADWEEFITAGIERPCGIEINGTKLLVGDYATGIIHIYEIAGGTPIWLGQIETGSDGLAGIKVGPDGKIWYVNYLDNTLVRIEDTSVSVDEMSLEARMDVYPNPANDEVSVMFSPRNGENNFLIVTNALGQEVMNQQINSTSLRLNVSSLDNGVYNVVIEENGITVAREQVVIQR
ncbi:MAG: T9SS type A sorting domain-containing protein [Flavobacteriales bacterium]|nr:T9SS type A sorting domain-containing protein [Flavobacteriales bacterium]